MKYLPQAKQDPTAFELYRKEHPEMNFVQARFGFVVMTLSVMVVILGGIYYIQHIKQIFGMLLFLAAIYGFKRFK